MTIEETISIGMGYLQQGLSIVRTGMSNLISFTGVDGKLFTLILMLGISLLLGRILVKRFVTKPWSIMYLPWTLIISLLIFVVLMYL